MFSIYFYVHSIFSFFFNDPATTEIYTLSLHDALPICSVRDAPDVPSPAPEKFGEGLGIVAATKYLDRKSTRLNSSHTVISYAVFCLKKKKEKINKSEYNHINHLKTYKQNIT